MQDGRRRFRFSRARLAAVVLFALGSPTLAQCERQTLVSGRIGKDTFGNFAALSDDGRTALVAASYTLPLPSNLAGDVQVWRHDGTSWSMTQSIRGPEERKRYGTHVALSGDGRIGLWTSIHACQVLDESGRSAWISNPAPLEIGP